MKELLTRYAQAVVQVGVNLQPDEVLVVASDVEIAPMTREVVRQGYLAGAKKVVVLWRDEQVSLLDLTLGEGRKLLNRDQWEIDCLNTYADGHAAYVNLISGDPEIYASVDPKLLAKTGRLRREQNAKFYKGTQVNDIKWCLVGIPTTTWAVKVFPDLSPEEALPKLWQAVAHTMRLDLDDTVEEWRAHVERLHHRCRVLNDLRLRSLHYTNSLGTDLVVKLPRDYVFAGGSELSSKGCEFVANMPTEEVFSAPHKYGVDGKVVASMPLFHNGARIENFGLEFKDGRVVNYWADKGLDVLKEIVDTDEGSHYLGEVALVPFASTVRDLDTLFLDTLFDENASCHLALGSAYPTCVKGGENMSEEELDKAGINTSHTHVDFMLGTADLSIVGEDEQGNSHVIFEQGNFAI